MFIPDSRVYDWALVPLPFSCDACGMAIPVVEFSRKGYKIRKVFG
jgi:hypothetical protein